MLRITNGAPQLAFILFPLCLHHRFIIIVFGAKFLTLHKACVLSLCFLSTIIPPFSYDAAVIITQVMAGVVHVHVGQCGNQVGERFWSLASATYQGKLTKGELMMMMYD